MMALARLIRALAIVAALGGVAVPAALAGPKTAATEGWRVLESHGGARFRPANEQYWWPARTGGKIPHGSIIATGSSGFLIIARAGESITVRPNSRVELPGEATGDQVRQTTGDLRYRITRVPDRRFAVETPYLSLLVKGTVFEVVVGASGAEVQVTEGLVRVDAARAQFVELSPGQSARIASGAQADLEFRPAPERPFVAAPFSRRSIAAAYSNEDSGGPPRNPPPPAGQVRYRSDPPVSDRGGSGRSVSDAAASGDRSAASAAGPAEGSGQAPSSVAADGVGSASGGDGDPAPGVNSGIEIGVSADGMWIDTARAQIAEVTPGQDTTIARSARADRESGLASESSVAASPPQPETTALVESGDGNAPGTGSRPRETADKATDRAVQASARGVRSSDALAWAVLVALAAVLWWRLRRSRHRQSVSHGAAWRWPWQRSRLDASGSSAGSAGPGTSSTPAVRDGT